VWNERETNQKRVGGEWRGRKKGGGGGGAVYRRGKGGKGETVGKKGGKKNGKKTKQKTYVIKQGGGSRGKGPSKKRGVLTVPGPKN